MLFPIFVILSAFALTWPNFCVMITFIISPRMQRWKILVIAATASLLVFFGAMYWLISSAIEETKQMHKIYGDKLPPDIILNQDGYGYLAFGLLLMLFIALGMGLPMAAGFLGRIQPMLEDLE
jgi:membrane protein YqaA with SNARE-associated domain